jgi:hypothetical protein
VGSVYRVKRFTTWSRNVANISLMTKRSKRRCQVTETAVKKLLCCGFRRTGKAIRQAYQCWWRIYREIHVFSRFEYQIFYVLYQFVTYLLTLLRVTRRPQCLQEPTTERKCNPILPTIFITLYLPKFHRTVAFHSPSWLPRNFRQ